MKKLLVKNIGLLATPEGKSAHRGSEQGKIKLLKDAWVLIEDGRDRLRRHRRGSRSRGGGDRRRRGKARHAGLSWTPIRTLFSAAGGRMSWA